MVNPLKRCTDCRFFAADTNLCSAPQISEFCHRLMFGVELEGATMPASEVRLNEALCSRGGFWFAPHPR